MKLFKVVIYEDESRYDSAIYSPKVIQKSRFCYALETDGWAYASDIPADAVLVGRELKDTILVQFWVSGGGPLP